LRIDSRAAVHRDHDAFDAQPDAHNLDLDDMRDNRIPLLQQRKAHAGAGTLRPGPTSRARRAAQPAPGAIVVPEQCIAIRQRIFTS
jgi:hypothetical protein